MSSHDHQPGVDREPASIGFNQPAKERTLTRDLLLDDFVVTLLVPGDSLLIHLVEAHDHLLHTEGVGEQSVLTGLTVLGITAFELTLEEGKKNRKRINDETALRLGMQSWRH
jgi:hypothetical protein